MWPGFNFHTRHHMWVEFFGSLLCIWKVFPLVLQFSPLIKKPTFDLCNDNNYCKIVILCNVDLISSRIIVKCIWSYSYANLHYRNIKHYYYYYYYFLDNYSMDSIHPPWKWKTKPLWDVYMVGLVINWWRAWSTKPVLINTNLTLAPIPVEIWCSIISPNTWHPLRWFRKVAVIVRADKLTAGLRHDLQLPQHFKTCFKMLRHFSDLHTNCKSCCRPVVSLSDETKIVPCKSALIAFDIN